MEKQVERARYGEVVYERPSPDELDAAGERVRRLRRNLFVLRSEAEQLRQGWAPLAGDDGRYRDVEGLLTAALVLLYDAEVRFPKWAEAKREKLAHPETYVVKEGFPDQRREDALVEVWWWDKYHQQFGPDLVPLPWRTKNNDN
jgi:hypothetical protein